MKADKADPRPNLGEGKRTDVLLQKRQKKIYRMAAKVVQIEQG